MVGESKEKSELEDPFFLYRWNRGRSAADALMKTEA
jgi:aminoglycoside phosphotransferase (APT) family kinase protein